MVTNADNLTIRKRRAGVTLVELLVVMGIIVAVMAIAVPVVRLVSDGSKVAAAADEVQSFVRSVQGDAKANGGSFMIFERNHNNPNLCTRVYRGKPRPDYRGEDYTSYTVPGGLELVQLEYIDPVGGGTENLTLPCQAFYVYNADVNKIIPYQYLQLEGRMEQYRIIKARMLPETTDVVNAGVYRPVVKIMAFPDSAGNNLKQSTMDVVANQTGGLTRQPVDPTVGFTNWADAFSTGGVENEFWPNTPLWTNTLSNPNYDASLDFPQPANTGLRTYSFSITQPPYIDEMNYLTMPEGMGIRLNATGFDSDGVAAVDFPGADGIPSAFAFNQFAWPDAEMDLFPDAVIDMELMESEAAVATILDGETEVPAVAPANNFQVNLAIDGTTRTSYFPMVEFDETGSLVRSYTSSPFVSAVLSEGADIVRMTPFEVFSPLYLLVGKEESFESTRLLGDDDYWVVVNNQSGRTTVLKSESVDLDGDGIVTFLESRRSRAGGSEE